jgi:lipoate-protein ligase A
MKNLTLTFSDPAHNLACDEAILRLCEEGAADEILRIWEAQTYFVVVGYSNRVETEVNVGVCEESGIPILRRFTGGGAVVQGPGCLNYTVVLRKESAANLDVRESYERVLSVHQKVFQTSTAAPVERQGISDITVAGRKFSGNAQHRSTDCVLVHGSFLISFDIALIEKLLRMPSRQPEYRQARSHISFLTNFAISARLLRESLIKAWGAEAPFEGAAGAKIEQLVRDRYSRPEWNKKF